MSIEQTWRITSTAADATLRLAAQIGSRLRGDELIELISDLGGGKTTFVKGLAAGMGSQDIVSSPTFTINNEYGAGKLRLYHFDFYRLGEAGVMSEELQEILVDPHAVTVIEWAGIVSELLPVGRCTITIKVTAETEREFVIRYPSSMTYLFAGLVQS